MLEHIQYNHMVYRKTLRQVLHSLHFPPVDQQLLDRLATECRNEATLGNRKHNNLTPFARRKRSVSKVNKKSTSYATHVLRKMEGGGKRVHSNSQSV